MTNPNADRQKLHRHFRDVKFDDPIEMGKRYNRRNAVFETSPALLGANALNSWVVNTSSARSQMTSSHFGQLPVLLYPTDRRIVAGVEFEHAKYTYSVVAPCDLTVLHVIPYYQRSIDRDGINHNPVTYVIYQDAETRELGVLELPEFHNEGSKFGFRFERTPAYLKATTPMTGRLTKGEVILRAPCVSAEGDLQTGIQLNVAYMTLPGTAEDSIIISEEAARLLSTRTYMTVTAEFDDEHMPRMLYKDAMGNPKPFPDIGEKVAENGLLMAVMNRKLTENDADLMAPFERSMRALQQVDHIFDTPYYAPPGGLIVDLRVDHQHRYRDSSPLDAQAEKYFSAAQRFSENITNVYKTYQRTYGVAPVLKPELSNLMVNCHIVNPPNADVRRAVLVHKQDSLAKWRITFVIEYVRPACIGSKGTDGHAGKGVVTSIWPTENMPVDAAGVRAHVIQDPHGTINRMDPGRSIEQYEGSAMAKFDMDICTMLGIKYGTTVMKAEAMLRVMDPAKVDAAFEFAKEFYRLFNEETYQGLVQGVIGVDKASWLAPIVYNGVRIWLPTDNPKYSPHVVMDIERSIYQPVYGPVKYIGITGIPRTTKGRVRIGTVYFYLLSKIGDDWNAVSAGPRQAHGVPAAMTASCKYVLPWRAQHTRCFGETETRVVGGNAGGEVMAEIMDRSCSPASARLVAYTLMTHNTPTNIPRIIDRHVHPFGGSSPLAMAHHEMHCAGLEFKYRRTGVLPR